MRNLPILAQDPLESCSEDKIVAAVLGMAGEIHAKDVQLMAQTSLINFVQMDAVDQEELVTIFIICVGFNNNID